MTTLLSIALLLVGAVSTFTAFGGKTWLEGPEPILKRVTIRGWLSLIFLIVALLLGVWKELATRSEQQKKDADAKVERQKSEDVHAAEIATANEKQKALLDTLNATRGELEAVKALNQATQDRLTESSKTLNDVHSTLGKTREFLAQESVSNFVTALANAHLTVSDIMVILPFTAQASSNAEFRRAMLPPFANNKCADLTG